ncbi:MAG TPA: hypothetical protein VFA20_29200, partial [Myxococcaceae bacterium]|nr:hypothetical protein [Myxococcaceae bacterium]
MTKWTLKSFLLLLVPLALAACGPEAFDPNGGTDEAGPAVSFLSKDGLNGAPCALEAFGEARCHGWVKLDPDGKPSSGSTPSGLFPADLQAAYNLNTAAGSGITVAIVDAYDNPKAESDLAVYRAQFGLPPCTTANGCFKKVNQTGGTRYPRGNTGWAEEIALDLDMVSAACPNCKILLVEADSATYANLGTAVNTAVAMGANVVSNSYGGSESSSELSVDSLYFNHPGIAITVSSGDSG